MKKIEITLHNGKKQILIGISANTISFGKNMFNNKGDCYLELYTEDKKCFKTEIVIDIDQSILGIYEPAANEIYFKMKDEWVESWDSIAADGTKVYENYLSEIPKKRTAKGSPLINASACKTA